MCVQKISCKNILFLFRLFIPFFVVVNMVFVHFSKSGLILIISVYIPVYIYTYIPIKYDLTNEKF